MEQRIKATVNADGTVTIETLSGFQGTSCAKETDMILQAIGGAVVESHKKAEYFEDGDNPVEVLSK